MDIDALIAEVTAKYPWMQHYPGILQSIIEQESRGRQDARSHRGAIGLMQLRPIAGREVGITNLHDPRSNVEAGAAYLDKMFKRWNNVETALAAYNWGPGNIARGSLALRPRETDNYVREVLDRIGRPPPSFME